MRGAVEGCGGLRGVQEALRERCGRARGGASLGRGAAGVARSGPPRHTHPATMAASPPPGTQEGFLPPSWALPAALTAGAAGLGLLYWRSRSRKPRNEPPGPWFFIPFVVRGPCCRPHGSSLAHTHEPVQARLHALAPADRRLRRVRRVKCRPSLPTLWSMRECGAASAACAPVPACMHPPQHVHAHSPPRAHALRCRVVEQHPCTQAAPCPNAGGAGTSGTTRRCSRHTCLAARRTCAGTLRCAHGRTASLTQRPASYRPPTCAGAPACCCQAGSGEQSVGRCMLPPSLLQPPLAMPVPGTTAHTAATRPLICPHTRPLTRPFTRPLTCLLCPQAVRGVLGNSDNVESYIPISTFDQVCRARVKKLTAHTLCLRAYVPNCIT